MSISAAGPNPGSHGQVSFRIIDNDDAAFLIELYGQTRDWEMAHTVWSESDRSDFIRGQYELQDHAYKTNFIGAVHRIIQLDGVDIGRLIINRRDDALHLIDLSLLTAYRRRGIGTDILKSLINEAHGGKVPMILRVERNNPAIRLYHRLGFRPVADLGQHIEMHWTHLPSRLHGQ